jgi:hypothetical protein
MSNYTLTTSSNGFGIWQCAVKYEYPGLGNSPEAIAIIDRSIRSAKRSIRRELQERNATKVRRLRYRVKANDVYHLNRIHGLTIEEA